MCIYPSGWLGAMRRLLEMGPAVFESVHDTLEISLEIDLSSSPNLE
jgi:hypothetical protein